MYKIMIIEDDVTIAKVIGEHLKKWGYETASIKNFEKVTEEVFAFEPHLILLDIMLPFLTVSTGVPRSGASRAFRSYSCLLRPII